MNSQGTIRSALATSLLVVERYSEVSRPISLQRKKLHTIPDRQRRQLMLGRRDNNTVRPLKMVGEHADKARNASQRQASSDHVRRVA